MCIGSFITAIPVYFHFKTMTGLNLVYLESEYLLPDFIAGWLNAPRKSQVGLLNVECMIIHSAPE